MYSVIKIRKRPFYVWFLRAVWLVWIIFWADVAIGSHQEMEERAFVISLVIFLVSLAIGFLLWLRGYRRFKKTNM